jgi:hypothetical protein
LELKEFLVVWTISFDLERGVDYVENLKKFQQKYFIPVFTRARQQIDLGIFMQLEIMLYLTY